MAKLRIKEISLEAFRNYGTYGNMTAPTGPVFGAPPVEFYRDMVQLDLGGNTFASFSVCRVEKRPPVVDVSEYHSCCGEGILPLDGDVVMHVATATPNGTPPAGIEIFRVPKGTFVALKPGVWHHGPFPVTNRPVNVLIVLPERAYANDCNVRDIPPAERVRF